MAAERGIGYVDAPVSGGVTKARTGQLSVMAGGEPEHVGQALPHVEPPSASVHHVGTSGAGHAAKK